MRKKNSISDFTSERDTHLLLNFRKALAVQSRISLEKAFRTASEAPAPQFWVSEQRAAIVIGRILAGDDPTLSMTPRKREMYRELYARVLTLRGLHPEASIQQLAFEAVNQPAPCAYLSWPRVRTLIYNERRRLRLERREA